MATPLLIVCRSNISGGFEAGLDVFNSDTGVFIEEKNYDADYPTGQDVECLMRKVDETYLGRFSSFVGVNLDTVLDFVSIHNTWVDPTASGAGAPQLYPDIPQAATRIVGLWQDFLGNPSSTVLQDINPTTLAQTTLWSDFQPDPSNGIAGCCLSLDGNTFYYEATLDILALDLATGITTTFITAPGGATGIETHGTYSMYELSNGKFLVFWDYGAGSASHLLRYNSDGTPDGFDLDTTSLFTPTLVSFAPSPLNDYIWVVGQGVSPDFFTTFAKYALPGGALLDSFTYGGMDFPVTGDLLIIAESAAVIIITSMSVDCDDSPISITITGINFPDTPTIVLTGPEGVNVTFNLVSNTSTTIVIDSLSPSFVNGQYCVTVS